jgi:glucan-binding YG repeat protein
MGKLKLFIATAVMSLALSFTSFAGQWQSDQNGWWYQNDDGTYPVNSWQWIDGNADGTSEYYYFNENGYCLVDTITPDGKTVNSNGALVVSGNVQTRTVQNPAPANKSTSNNGGTEKKVTVTQPAKETSQSTSKANNKEQMVWVSRTGTKYHSKSNCSNMKNPSHKTLSEAESLGRTPCSKCY